jgi:vitamin B12 transporter
MSKRVLRAAILVGVALNVLPICAQEQKQEQAPDLVITPNRIPMSIQQIGSSVTVISQEEIEKQGNKSLRDVLDGQPGISVVESGGPGGQVSVFMRGTESNHTLVLIDGVRMSDPTQTGGQFDMRTVPPQLIERIEIVRGPQSALYGSDAIGGVINIITKKGKSLAPQWSLRTEGGSYGTFSTNLSVAGATPDTTYAVGVNQFHSDGFKRYGYRIPRIGIDSNGTDPVNRYGFFTKLSRKVNDGLTLDLGVMASRAELQYDAGAYEVNPYAPQHEKDWTGNGYQKVISENGNFRTTFTTFETSLTRNYGGLKWPNYLLSASYKRYHYEGTRVGGEIQEDINLQNIGTATFGIRAERERANLDDAGKRANGFQDTKAAFFLYQVSPIDHLHLSTGARSDHISDFGVFNTYRLTAAYDLTQTMRLRSSYGTGAKAPSLYQLYSVDYGSTSLKPETSRGFDFGFEQTFFNGDARLSATYFRNDISNMIDTLEYPAGSWKYKYFNVNKARMSGIELGTEYNLVPTFVKLKTSYTFLDGQDRETGYQLARRPKHSGRVSVQYTPTRDWTVEPLLYVVSKRMDTRYDPPDWMSGYARIDLLADYKFSQQASLFARAENLTNTRYEEAFGYGTAGRSFFAGLKMTW